MADNVKEEIVRRRSKVFSMIGYVILVISALLAAIIAASDLMAVLSGKFSAIIMLVIFGGSAWLMWWGKDFMRVEYEYTFTNGIVDVAQVINNRRRKELISFRVREVTCVASTEDERLPRYQKTQNVKKIKAVLNVENPTYFAFFKKNEVNYLVYFEPSQDFLKLMRMYNERNVII